MMATCACSHPAPSTLSRRSPVTRWLGGRCGRVSWYPDAPAHQVDWVRTTGPVAADSGSASGPSPSGSAPGLPWSAPTAAGRRSPPQPAARAAAGESAPANRGERVRPAVCSRRPVLQAADTFRAVFGQPFVDRALRHAEGNRHRGHRPAFLNYPVNQTGSTPWRGTGILVDVHPAVFFEVRSAVTDQLPGSVRWTTLIEITSRRPLDASSHRWPRARRSSARCAR